ncbi:MAG: hypothetical protein D4S02_05745 [Rhodocyclaceae bacterium]|nr:MAG: hypothetical protein D4S02_05745 [Rhodocyclaceae bacterium]
MNTGHVIKFFAIMGVVLFAGAHAAADQAALPEQTSTQAQLPPPKVLTPEEREALLTPEDKQWEARFRGSKSPEETARIQAEYDQYLKTRPVTKPPGG